MNVFSPVKRNFGVIAKGLQSQNVPIMEEKRSPINGLKQLDLRPFRFTKNGYQKFFNLRSKDLGNNPLKVLTLTYEISVLGMTIRGEVPKGLKWCEPTVGFEPTTSCLRIINETKSPSTFCC